MDGGHCHCFDGGEWFCQDCNKMEFENQLIRDTVDLRNPYIGYTHERKIKGDNHE